jgi:hypothetical protein
MYRVSINKATGKIIESQSGGKVEKLPSDAFKKDKEYTAHLAACEALEASRLATLKTNALNAGYSEKDIEVKWVTDEEYAALTAPTKEERDEQEREAKILAEGQAILRGMAVKSLTERGEL